MNTQFLKSEHIYLRAIEPEDLDILYTIENDPQTWDISNFSVPYSKYALKQYIANSESDMYADRQLRLMITSCTTHEVLGTIDITDFSPMHNRGEVGISLLKQYQGCGYAQEALRLLCDYAFRFLGLKQLISHIPTSNKASIRLFENCNFTLCGLLKEWWRIGIEYNDVFVYQLLNKK